MGRRERRIPIPAPVERGLDVALDRALDIQRPAVVTYLDRARAKRPDMTPAEVVAQLERRYLVAVAGLGAAAGGAAAVPGIGTAASLASGVAEITAFVSTTALYVLAVAEVHGVPISDPEVRRALVLVALLGDGATPALRAAGTDSKHWADVIARRGSKEKVAGLNSRLGRLLLTRFGARQGALYLGRALPMGIGAGVGALGNAALARAAIAATRKAFGPAPARFGPRIIEGRTVTETAF